MQRDSERAAAWSEPVRRTAQPTATPPGVAYHRLSPDEHRWIFDELIVPTVLEGIVPQADPRVVYLIGQPGAGKTETADLLRRAMRPGTIRLSSNDFKAAHPDYLQLMKTDPRRRRSHPLRLPRRAGAAGAAGQDLPRRAPRRTVDPTARRLGTGSTESGF
ncbi:zeta toxin family protein [Streptomyces sp. NPDC002742]|uniref:zeta toxin family protein n=1 Tax=Streptomyces sp. NPDC002742 TaxID=3364663 RepID=UPI0036A9534B